MQDTCPEEQPRQTRLLVVALTQVYAELGEGEVKEAALQVLASVLEGERALQKPFQMRQPALDRYVREMGRSAGSFSDHHGKLQFARAEFQRLLDDQCEDVELPVGYGHLWEEGGEEHIYIRVLAVASLSYPCGSSLCNPGLERYLRSFEPFSTDLFAGDSRCLSPVENPRMGGRYVDNIRLPA